MTTNPAQESDRALAAHNAANLQLLSAIRSAAEPCYGSNWEQVGTAAHVRELLAQAAYAAGAITEDQAAAHGVTV